MALIVAGWIYGIPKPARPGSNGSRIQRIPVAASGKVPVGKQHPSWLQDVPVGHETEDSPTPQVGTLGGQEGAPPPAQKTAHASPESPPRV
jgi:hypothetical protein